MRNTPMHRSHANPYNPRHQERAPYIRLGYLDRIAGRPYCPEYESWAANKQNAYENGRLVASNILAADIPPPAWRKGCFRPAAYKEARDLAKARIGSFRPGPPLPPSNQWHTRGESLLAECYRLAFARRGRAREAQLAALRNSYRVCV